jgi:hypothetical protein
VESFARLIVLALGAALVVALIREGPGGPTRWVRAKFLGDPETADQQAAARITQGGVPVSPADIANAPPLQPNPPGVRPRATSPTGVRPRATSPTGVRSVQLPPFHGHVPAGPGHPVATF